MASRIDRTRRRDVRSRGEGDARVATHLVITVHGIRTFGPWQSQLKGLLESAEPGIRIRSYQYGFYSSIAFLFPFLRWLVARQFRRFACSEIAQMPEGSRIDLVAHSFGTYLVASALPHLPGDRPIHTVILAGSVLRPSFPWYRYQQAGRLRRVVNECGLRDSILVLCQSCALMMGMAGRVGFRAMIGDHFVNRYHPFGHGGYFDPESRFMREQWLPLLTCDRPIPPADARPPLGVWGGIREFVFNNLQFIKVAGALAVAAALVLIPLDWHRKAEFEKRATRLANLASLANAAQIPGRDPSHVSDALTLDASGAGESDSIKHAAFIGSSNLSGDPIDPDKIDQLAVEEGMLPWLHTGRWEAQRARLLHAAANRERSASRRERGGDPAGALMLYQDALRSYARIHDDDPAYGSYALCRIDYGLLLHERGQYDKAAEQFRKARTEVFPAPPAVAKAKGRGVPAMPASLEVDALCYEARAQKKLGGWKQAENLLWDASRKAGEDPALRSQVWNEIGWLRMERMEVARARDAFRTARQACEELVDDGQVLYQARLFHIDHGLAMADRLVGEPERSFERYDKIVKEISELLGRDLQFSPKERRDLRDRLVNSLERRADVFLFARDVPTLDPTEPAPSRPKVRPDLEAQYEEAIGQVPADDELTRVRLRLKKVVAGFVAEAEAEAEREPRPEGAATLRTVAHRPGEPPPRSRRDDPAVRLRANEYVEARRAFEAMPADLRKALKIYAQLADRCAEVRCALWHSCLHAESEPHARPHAAVGALRAFTREWAADCERLDRERVEMLLVGLEILLDGSRGLDPEGKPATVREDAARLMAVLGASTRVASQPELQPYADRFGRLAALAVISPGRASEPSRTAEKRALPTGREGVDEVPVRSLVEQSRVTYRLELRPWPSLTISRWTAEPSEAITRTASSRDADRGRDSRQVPPPAVEAPGL